jgi:energy-coupling factor transporter ATP-binding protein EcfA2
MTKRRSKTSEFSYSDLITWAKERLPEWQQDALRRLIEKSTLSKEDVDELTALAISPFVDDSCSNEPIAPSEDKELIETEQHNVKLTAVKDIERVNALAPGPINFDPNGITAIYGGNATGKSGFARILKKACSARDSGGKILPNVFETNPEIPAAATIEFIVNDDLKYFNWKDGGSKNPFLNSVNVFDSRCATVQIEKPNIISYTPEVLQLFRSLALVVETVAEELKTQKRTLGYQPLDISSLTLNDDTETGKFIANLSGSSKSDVLEKLCSMTDAETARLNELNRALSDDPAGRALTEEVRYNLIQKLETSVSPVYELLSDEACSIFENSLNIRNKTREAAETARVAFTEDADLSGIGTETWRDLWEAARKYSETYAYTEEKFPVLREGSICVLCQQDLSPKAQTRLRSFEEFVQGVVQKQADQAAVELSNKINDLCSLSIPQSIRKEMREAGVLDLPIGDETRKFFVIAKIRRRQLLRLAKDQLVADRPPLPNQPDFTEVMKNIQDEIERLRKASKSEEREKMENERAQLKDRETMSPHKKIILAEIHRLKKSSQFDQAIDTCKTQPITLKRREAVDSVITDRLRSNFQVNLVKLGLSESPVEVKLGAGEHGEHPFEMKLIARPDVRPENVLSEGERTCVALAGLLAEIETTSNRAALVLDDPVSSLDHQYRKRVAERLIIEAKGRQIIVFTHDITFLFLLRKYGVELNVAMSEVTLERGYKGNHGQAKEGPPWVAMPVKERLNHLRNDVLEARQILKNGNRKEYETHASNVYKSLRMTWERAVEEVLLNQTVVRFGDSIQTKRLTKLTDIDDNDVQLVTKEMSRCSDFEHDESGVVHADLPEPDVIDDDINRLAEWTKVLRKERNRS